ncbi:hypothetical protein ABNG14_48800 (plasmid) [Streptomyces rapamycinicus]
MPKRYAMGCYLGGAAAARAGDEMSGPALLLAGPVLTGSPSSGPALLAGTMAARVGGPLFGVLLDRSARPGRLLARRSPSTRRGWPRSSWAWGGCRSPSRFSSRWARGCWDRPCPADGPPSCPGWYRHWFSLAPPRWTR